MRITPWKLLLWTCLTCCPASVPARPFLKSSFLASSPTTKTIRPVSLRNKTVNSPIQPRGGDMVMEEPKTLLGVLFDARVALKTLSVALGCFGGELLLFPVMFRDTFLKNAVQDGSQVGSTAAMDFLQYLLGIRELFLSILFWKLAQDGSDDLCRLLVTISFFAISLPQLYYIARHDVLKNAQVQQFMLKLYAFFVWLNGMAMLKSWYDQWREATKVSYTSTM